jgi:hypothetical protein
LALVSRDAHRQTGSEKMIKENYTLFFFAIFLVWLTGTFVRRAIVRNETGFLGAGQWAVDFGLGAGIISFWLLLSSLLFGKIYFQSIFYIILCVGIFLLYRFWKSPDKSFWSPQPIHFSFRNFDISGCILLTLFFLIICTIWMKAYFGPVEWDAWYQYGYHAKAFYFDKTIKPEFMIDPSPYFLSAVDYRIILSMTEAWIFYTLDGVWDNSYGFLTTIYYLALLSFLYYIIKNSFSQVFALLVIFLVGSMIPTIYLGSTGLVDLVLAYYIFGGCFFLHRWLLTKNISFIILSALFFVFSAMTKNEGISIAVITIFALWIYAGLSKKNFRKANLRHVTYFSILLIVGFMPYLFAYFKNYFFHHSYSAYFAHNSQTLVFRMKLIFSTLVHEWIDFDAWGFLWIFLLAGLVSSIVRFIQKKNLESGIIWLIILSQGLIYFLVLLTHPGDLPYFLSKTPDRLFFHLIPTMIYLSLVQWKVEKVEVA